METKIKTQHKTQTKNYIFSDIPFGQYQSSEGISRTDIVKILQSPAHYKAYKELGIEETPALTLGRAIHTKVLEPHQFDELFVYEPTEINKRTKAGKLEYETFLEDNAGKTILNPKDKDKIESIAQSVKNHPIANGLISNNQIQIENSMFWTDKLTGLQCKARPDALLFTEDKCFIIDLKTTQNASPHSFSKAVANYNYHIQAQFYIEGVQTVHEEQDPDIVFIFIAVEKEPPYEIGVYELDQAFLGTAEEQIRKALALHKQCIETGEYPGYSKELIELQAPKWLEYQYYMK